MTDVITSIASSGGDYTTVALWESDWGGSTGADFVTNTETVIGEVANEALTTSGTITIRGATTNSTYKWILRAASGAENKGDTTAGARLLNSGNTEVLAARDDYIVLEDLHLRASSSSEDAVIQPGPYEVVNVTISRCIISSAGSTDTGNYGVQAGNYASTINCDNSLFIDLGATACNSIATPTFNFYNCVATDCNKSNNSYRGGFFAGRSTITLKNCVAYNNLNDDYYGTSATLTNCASEDTTAYGTDAITGIASGDFNAAASDDYHLSGTSSALYDEGADPSGGFTTDIDGDTWVTWSIGFDHISGGGGGSIIPQIMHHRRMMQ